MTAARVVVSPTFAAASYEAAQEFVRHVGALSCQSLVRVVLSGGKTPKFLYRLLTEPNWRQRVDWQRLRFFWSDERSVPPTHPESNFRMAWEALLAPLGVGKNQIFRMRGEASDLEAAAREYESEIARNFGIAAGAGVPQFDFVLLGLGADGHTASLFPHTAALAERRRWVVANVVPQLGATRITLTYPILNAARCVLFLVGGSSKAEAVARVFDPDASVDDVPARGVCPGGGELIWILDEAAASRLKS